MATPAGLEDSHPVTIITEEDEPLLGQVGDLNHSQEQHEKIIFNFISGIFQLSPNCLPILS